MQNRSYLLYLAFAFTALLGIIHIFALFFYLYWSYWWLDILTHFLAGLSGGLAAYWMLFCSGHFLRKPVNSFVAVLLTVTCLMIAGVVWEVFEYIYDIADVAERYVLDTSLDLTMDALGAIVAVFIGLKHTQARAISPLR